MLQIAMENGPAQIDDIHIELPIFEQLLSLDKEVKQRFPGEDCSGFEELGLSLHKPSD
ncbi:MAG: hypothetical protein AAF572_17795 [Cyanobacteria bacterium P01_B01_bin.77]